MKHSRFILLYIGFTLSEMVDQALSKVQILYFTTKKDQPLFTVVACVWFALAFNGLKWPTLLFLPDPIHTFAKKSLNPCSRRLPMFGLVAVMFSAFVDSPPRIATERGNLGLRRPRLGRKLSVTRLFNSAQ